MRNKNTLEGESNKGVHMRGRDDNSAYSYTKPSEVFERESNARQYQIESTKGKPQLSRRGSLDTFDRKQRLDKSPHLLMTMSPGREAPLKIRASQYLSDDAGVPDEDNVVGFDVGSSPNSDASDAHEFNHRSSSLLFPQEDIRSTNEQGVEARIPRGARDMAINCRRISKPPQEKFPTDLNPVRESVAPRKDALEKGIPPGARWTKIGRRLVDPAVLEESHERFEERQDHVIVLRVLSKEEVQGYASKTQEMRDARQEEHLNKGPQNRKSAEEP